MSRHRHSEAHTNGRKPNDDEEQDRMDLGHHIYRLVLGGDLFLAPIGDKVKRVLDLGTGTGIWAMDFAEYTSPHPSQIISNNSQRISRSRSPRHRSKPNPTPMVNPSSLHITLLTCPGPRLTASSKSMTSSQTGFSANPSTLSTRAN